MFAGKKVHRICFPSLMPTSLQPRLLGKILQARMPSTDASRKKRIDGGGGGKFWDVQSKTRFRSRKEPVDWEVPLRRWLDHKTKAIPEDGLVYFQKIAQCSKGRTNDLLQHPGYHSLQKFLIQHVESLHVEEIAEILRLCGKFRLIDKKLQLPLISRLQKCSVESLPDKWLGLLPWSLYLLRCNGMCWQLIQDCTEELMQRLDSKRFHDHDALGNLCWTLASSGRWPAKLADLVTDYMDDHMNSFSPNELSNLLWSMQKLKHASKTMFTKSLDVFRTHLAITTEASCERIFWSLGDKKHYDESYYNAIAEKILSGGFPYSCRPHFLCNFVSSCASVRFYHATLMDYVSKTLLPILNRLSIHHHLKLAHSFSFLNHIDKDLLFEVARRVSRRKSLVDDWNISNLVWACLVADVYPPELFQILFARLSIEKTFHTNLSLGQLDVATTVEHPELGFPAVPMFHRTKLLNKTLNIPKRRFTPFQQNVMDVLQYILKQDRVSLSYDVSTLQGYSIDVEILLDCNNQPIQYESVPLEIAKLCFLCKRQGVDQRCLHGRFELLQHSLSMSSRVKRRDWNSSYLASDWELELPSTVTRRIAIEADGPQHFSANSPHHLLGRTVLKERQLKALGWEVIKIPYFEWDPLHSSREKIDYMEKKLF